MQFTLVLTVVLVVMVIFVFLRKLRATVIPSVALPLSIIGTFGLEKLAGYSLDNLSLIALTISTGFVVDDAIVMIENIVRYIEAGEPPFEAALKGAKQIGFTVVSLSVSRIAVFIPLLFVTGIVGRLFREFAVTLSAAVVVSAVISLTLTPMMGAKLLKPEAEEDATGKDKQGHHWFYRWTERLFDGMLAWYEGGLKWVLRHRLFTLLVTVATIFLYVVTPKGLLPQQNTGVIIKATDAAQNISVPAMVERQRAVAEIARQDPDLQSVASFVGAGSVNATLNTGRMTIVLKGRNERNSNAEAIIARPRRATANLQGSRSSPRRCRTSSSTRASAARSTSTSCRMPTRPSWANGRRPSSNRCEHCRS